MNNTTQIFEAYKNEWRFFRQRMAGLFAVVVLLFCVTLLFSYSAALQNREFATDLFFQIQRAFEIKGFSANMDQWELFGAILANNLIAGFMALALGIVPFLFLPVWAVVSNAVIIGVVIAASQIAAGYDLTSILISLLPHGIFELPAFFYSASLGLHISLVLTKKIFGKGNETGFLASLSQAIKSYFMVIVPLLVVAAFIESYISYAIAR